MTRGRRPNLTLEPSRQLQTQRAFRERKAAHLRHLEDTVKSQADKILQLKRRLGEDVSEDESSSLSSNEMASSSSPNNNKRRRSFKVEHTPSAEDVLKQVLYTPPSTSTSPVPIPMSPLPASNSAPPTHTCTQCQRLRLQNTELNRMLADSEKQLAFYRQQSAPTTNTSASAASSGSGFSENTNATSPPSPSSPVYNQRYPYTAPSASYVSKVPPPHQQHQQHQHARIQWTQPLSPSLQMQYGSGPGTAPVAPAPPQAQAAFNNTSSNPYQARQRYSTAPDSQDEQSSRPTTAAGATTNATFTTNTPVAYHPPPLQPATQSRPSPSYQPSRQCGPPQAVAAPVGIQADQDSCCLGIFACDGDGRIIV